MSNDENTDTGEMASSGPQNSKTLKIFLNIREKVNTPQCCLKLVLYQGNNTITWNYVITFHQS